jgi:hypothetical protein
MPSGVPKIFFRVSFTRSVMSDFETYTCDNCSEEFKAHPSGNAAANTYCSPACETAGKGL